MSAPTLYGGAPMTGGAWFDFVFYPGNLWVVLAMSFAVLVAVGYIGAYFGGEDAKTSSIYIREAPKAAAPAPSAPVAVPVVNPQAVAPAKPALVAPKVLKVDGAVATKKVEIARVEKKPVLDVKSVEIAAPQAAAPKPVLEPKSVEIEAPVAAPEVVAPEPVAAPEAPAPVPAPTKSSLEATYEAYRNAMLSTGSRAAAEPKAAPAPFFASAIRSAFGSENTADFLQRSNVSVNDRMVAIFDAVKA